VVGADKDKVVDAIANFRPRSDLCIFGDGRASERIANIIGSRLGL